MREMLIRQSWLKNIMVTLAEVLPRGVSTCMFLFGAVFITAALGDEQFNKHILAVTSPHTEILLKSFNTAFILSILYWFSVNIISALYGRQCTRSLDDGMPMAAACLSSPREKKPLTEERVSRVAYHEAGHLLATRYFNRKPNKLSAQVKVFEEPTLGSVSYEFDDDFICTIHAHEAAMKVSLAGALAEEITYGDCQVGTQTDNQRWERQARNMLSAFVSDYHWFHSVTNEYEARVNSNTLVEIKKSITAEVSEMLAENKNLLDEAAKYLEVNGESDGDALHDFVARVDI